jgi:hypothetical protein
LSDKLEALSSISSIERGREGGREGGREKGGRERERMNE